jgi:DNA repair protein RAD5
VDFKASGSRLVFIHTVSIEIHTSLDMVYIRGVMTDCPENLTTGASLIVTLHIYLLVGAFKATNNFQSDDASIHFGFNEGLESEEERYCD